jgi:hypothetical protein
MTVSFTISEIESKIAELKVMIDDSEEQILFWKRLLTMAKTGATPESAIQEGEDNPI